MQGVKIYILGVLLTMAVNVMSQTFPKATRNKVAEVVTATIPAGMGIDPVKVLAMKADAKRKVVTVNLSDTYGDVPFVASDVEDLAKKIKQTLGSNYRRYDVRIKIAGNDIEKYLVDYDKAYARHHSGFVTALSENYHYSKGLNGNVIALWQSHGRYFEPRENRWKWQRACLNQTVEDLYTQSYVIPFLMPMLENAGAYVMSPRERDIHDFEVIVDNDGKKAQAGYSEKNGENRWHAGDEAGFAWARESYVDYENPFREGSYRQVEATKHAKKASVASWSATMPEAGEYAVYVSYKTLPESVEDVVYTVNYLDGKRKFKVNQKMGSGTWVYLGHFPLKKGENENVVELSNYSSHKGIITADAVKIGGGVGNVARKVKKPEEGEAVKYLYNDSVDYKYTTSGYPRFTEGARYWLQWAGCPDSVYAKSRLTNDYMDDYRSRGDWVNWLAGGSDVMPDSEGLNIPIDLAFAFHTDAGATLNDSIVGTLGIYMTSKFANYANGTPRAYSRLLTNAISTSVCNDIRAQYEPRWTRRGMWDKSYYEARVPEVPTMLLELLSHQNFADMRYGLDPTFRFAVSRAIYKGMLEFIAKRDGKEYEVQPLPVHSFAIEKEGNNRFRLSWKPTTDSLVAGGAMPLRYIVEERVGSGAFKEVAVVEKPHYDVEINDNNIHSYKIIAVNEGGRSFESEVLALGVAPKAKGTVMVVNGFTRISAPESFAIGEGKKAYGGFLDDKDSGVPYKYDISYTGSQTEFRRNMGWRDDDAPGYGSSYTQYEDKVIAGNTFDYPVTHGEAIMAAGYSFISSSVKAVEDGLKIKGCFAMDLILGKQKEIRVGRGAIANRYKIYTPSLMEAIKRFTTAGGSVFATGAYVGSDAWAGLSSGEQEQTFAKQVLGFEWLVDRAANDGNVTTVASQYSELKKDANYKYSNEFNDALYRVESADAIRPASEKASIVFRYSQNKAPAGVAADMGKYRTVIAGFPFETIESKEERCTMMQQVLNFFAAEKRNKY